MTQPACFFCGPRALAVVYTTEDDGKGIIASYRLHICEHCRPRMDERQLLAIGERIVRDFPRLCDKPAPASSAYAPTTPADVQGKLK